VDLINPPYGIVIRPVGSSALFGGILKAIGGSPSIRLLITRTPFRRRRKNRIGNAVYDKAAKNSG
jgi:hypothetical protein